MCWQFPSRSFNLKSTYSWFLPACSLYWAKNINLCLGSANRTFFPNFIAFQIHLLSWLREPHINEGESYDSSWINQLGDSDGARTRDLLRDRQAFWPTELRSQVKLLVKSKRSYTFFPNLYTAFQIHLFSWSRFNSACCPYTLQLLSKPRGFAPTLDNPSHSRC